MKYLTILIISIFLLPLSLFSQKNMTKYESAFFEKTFNVDISFDKKGSFNLWIDAYSLDALYKNGGIRIKEKNHAKCIETLNNAKAKYREWKQVAIANNIEDFSKGMDFEFKIDGYFLSGKEWHFDYYVKPDIEFKTLKTSQGEIKHILIVRTNELEASDNEYMDVDGVALVFESEAEIDSFIKAISMSSIEAFKKKPSKEDLFK